MSEDIILKKIDADIKNTPVILYVKGNKMFPRCGFSKAVMDIFTEMQVPFETRDVLEDADLRDGIKRYTSWPTIPQVFVKGQFIGGCDIVMEMYQKGELVDLVKDIS